jgi:hypothetical protein
LILAPNRSRRSRVQRPLWGTSLESWTNVNRHFRQPTDSVNKRLPRVLSLPLPQNGCSYLRVSRCRVGLPSAGTVHATAQVRQRNVRDLGPQGLQRARPTTRSVDNDSQGARTIAQRENPVSDRAWRDHQEGCGPSQVSDTLSGAANGLLSQIDPSSHVDGHATSPL